MKLIFKYNFTNYINLGENIMAHYKNHLEHLKDVIHLTETIPFSQETVQINMSELTVKESLSLDIFLPLVHLSDLYHLDIAAKEVLYIIVSANLSRTSVDFLSSINNNIFNRYYITFFLEIMEDTKTYKLKPRIINYLLDPYTVLESPWLTYSYTQTDTSYPIAEKHIPLTKIIESSLNDSQQHIIMIKGSDGIGRKTLLSYSTNSQNIPLLFVDIEQLIQKQTIDFLLEEILLESKLMRCFLCFLHIEIILENNNTVLQTLLFYIKKNYKLTFFISTHDILNWTDDCLILSIFTMDKLSSKTIQNLWKHLLSKYNFDKEPDYKYLSETFSFTPLEMKHCIQKVKTASMENNNDFLSIQELYDICKIYNIKTLPILGSPIISKFKWEDLILPLYQKELLTSIISRIHNQDLVFNQWGYSEKLSYGKGICVLFEGSPGTGKTMAASVLANELNIPIYQINLASIVSKYIGETEKNLQMIFDEAEQVKCLLFFDEADALFGKRTAVYDSKDKFANLETSFLLQKLESYNGITILATNLIQNLDEAFRRRFHYIIKFSNPNEECRKKLWKSMFPSKLPIDEPIDFDYLAKQFSISGSTIKQVALSASFIAANKKRGIIMQDIITALKEDSNKTGISLQARDLGIYG